MCGPQCVSLLCCVWMATPADYHVEQDGYIKHVCLLLNVWDTVCLSVVLRMVGNFSRPPYGTGWLHQACLFAAKCAGHSMSVCCVAYGWQLQQTSMWNRMATSSMFVCC